MSEHITTIGLGTLDRALQVECSSASQDMLVLSQDLDLPSLFASMEEARIELGVEEYSISQTTLEHVFVALAEVGTEQDGGISAQ